MTYVGLFSAAHSVHSHLESSNASTPHWFRISVPGCIYPGANAVCRPVVQHLYQALAAVSGGAVLHAQKFYLRNVPSIDKVGGPADGLTCIVTGPTRSFRPSLSLHLCFPALHCADLPTLSLPLCFSAPLESSSACAAWLQWPWARDCRSACAAQSARYGAQVRMPAFDALRPASVCNPLRFSRLPLPHAMTVMKAMPCNHLAKC